MFEYTFIISRVYITSRHGCIPTAYVKYNSKKYNKDVNFFNGQCKLPTERPHFEISKKKKKLQSL